MTPSRILDTTPTTEPSDPGTDHGHTCTTQNGRTRNPDPARGKCGKPAVVEVMRTCCDAPGVIYWCTEHLTENTTMCPLGCIHCRHRCDPGVCLHRIITPL